MALAGRVHRQDNVACTYVPPNAIARRDGNATREHDHPLLLRRNVRLPVGRVFQLFDERDSSTREWTGHEQRRNAVYDASIPRR